MTPKHDDKRFGEFMDRNFSADLHTARVNADDACNRVLQRLQYESEATEDHVPDRLRDAATFQNPGQRHVGEPIHAWQTPWRVAVICAAIAAALVVALSLNIWKTPTSTTKTLADGSRIELRAGAEAVVENVPDGLMIRLNSGSMMVFAAKQAAGRHLYVQTRDLKVSVVGTVFLVNADDKGSRVAVIEGEVRVQQGTVEKSLRPGERFPFNPKSEDLKFFQETGWSREAFAYLSKLHESMAQSLAARQSPERTPTVSDKAKFEEASIRLCEQDIQAPAGARGGGSGSIRITPGRVDALCMTVATLIKTAHRSLNNNPGRRDLRMNSTTSFPPEDGTRVKGGPDWVRSEKYTIAAVGDSTDASKLQGPMFLELLERRFKLKLRIETEEIPVYALTIAKGGLKIKPLDVKYDEVQKILPSISAPSPGARGIDPKVLNALATYSGLLGCSLGPEAPRNDRADLNRYLEAIRRGVQPPDCGRFTYGIGPNALVTGGAAPIGVLVDHLSSNESLNDTLNGLLVVDKTGLPDTNCVNLGVPATAAIRPAGTLCAPLFNFVLEYVRDESYFTLLRTRTGETLAQLGLDLSLPKAPNIFDALEKLGLHLEKSKASREFIAIEHIERPSPN